MRVGQWLILCLGSIVAIHGLTGHWRQTWTHDNGACWLTDFLPDQFPNARIMAYGYNANIFLSKAVTDIKQEAEMLLRYLENNRQQPEEKKRPIVLIGHSLGGILVKKVLLSKFPNFSASNCRGGYWHILGNNYCSWAVRKLRPAIEQHKRSGIFCSSPSRGRICELGENLF